MTTYFIIVISFSAGFMFNALLSINQPDEDFSSDSHRN